MTTLTAPTSATAPCTRPSGAPILVAVAGTGDPTRGDVLQSAALLAAHAGVPLVVLVVAEPLPSYLPDTDTIVYISLAEEQARAGALLESARAAACAVLDPALAVSYRVMVGDPARTIARAAREADAALVVVGIGRHGLLDRILGSETALRVMKLADRPVLAVARALTTLPARALVAVDFAPSSVRAAEAVLPYLAPRASLTLAHVWSRGALDADEVDGAASGRALLPTLARLGRSIGAPADTAVHPIVLEGGTVEQLLTFARSDDVDVIAVGRRSLTWVDRLFVGSVTSALVRSAPCAVLVAPATDPPVRRDELSPRNASGV